MVGAWRVLRAGSIAVIAGDSVYTLEPAESGAPPFAQTLTQHDKNKDGKIELTEITGEGVGERGSGIEFSSRWTRTAATATAWWWKRNSSAPSAQRQAGLFVRGSMAPWLSTTACA